MLALAAAAILSGRISPALTAARRGSARWPLEAVGRDGRRSSRPSRESSTAFVPFSGHLPPVTARCVPEVSLGIRRFLAASHRVWPSSSGERAPRLRSAVRLSIEVGTHRASNGPKHRETEKAVSVEEQPQRSARHGGEQTHPELGGNFEE